MAPPVRAGQQRHVLRGKGAQLHRRCDPRGIGGTPGVVLAGQGSFWSKGRHRAAAVVLTLLNNGLRIEEWFQVAVDQFIVSFHQTLPFVGQYDVGDAMIRFSANTLYKIMDFQQIYIS